MTTPNTTAAKAVPLHGKKSLGQIAYEALCKRNGDKRRWSEVKDYAAEVADWESVGEAVAAAAVAAERERWQRIFENAQAVTTGSEDKIDYFQVPSHLMAALALALDEAPTNT